MLSDTNDQHLHRVTLGVQMHLHDIVVHRSQIVQVRLLRSWHEHVQYTILWYLAPHA